jgi:hypothetical protein
VNVAPLRVVEHKDADQREHALLNWGLVPVV